MPGDVIDLTGPRRARVLVVDDDRLAAETLHQVLAASGFHVAVVRSDRLALEVVAHEEVSALVLANTGRGIAATTRLVTAMRNRPEPQLRDAGIVALVDEEVDAAFGLGDEADAVLVRPVDAARLADVVTEVAATDPASRSARRRSDDGSFFRYRMRLAVS